MKTIGILGGMGPLATADLYRKIIFHTKADRDQDHVPTIIDSNTAIPDRTRAIVGDGENPLPELIRSAQRLEQAGADFLIVPCNTAHYFYADLAASVSIPILNMIGETLEWIARVHGKSTVVGLMATDGTVRSGVYEMHLRHPEMRIVKNEAVQRDVMDFIYECVKKGNFAFGVEGFFRAVDELRGKGAEVFVLGCTELSSAKDLFGFEGNFVDPMDVLARRAIECAGGVLRDE